GSEALTSIACKVLSVSLGRKHATKRPLLGALCVRILRLHLQGEPTSARRTCDSRSALSATDKLPAFDRTACTQRRTLGLALGVPYGVGPSLARSAVSHADCVRRRHSSRGKD